MDLRKHPPIPADLIDYLDKAYPEKSPDPEHSEREIWMKAGERRLVRTLLQRFKRQEEAGYVHI